MRTRTTWAGASLLALVTIVAACQQQTRGKVAVEGSSTVAPVGRLMANHFAQRERVEVDVTIPVGVSGTAGGFRGLCGGKVDIASASRPIDSAEKAACRASAVEFIEAPIGYDGIAVVVHAQNDWAQELTLSELQRIWEPAAEGQVTRWRDIRPTWPDASLNLYGPGSDSGTRDHFTSVTVGKRFRSAIPQLSGQDE